MKSSCVSPCRSVRGFTLVELLVSVFILILLGTLVLSLVTSARARAVDANCIGKLRQLGQGALAAAFESNGYLAATFFDPENAGAGKTYWWEVVAPRVYTRYGDEPNYKKLDGLFRDPTRPAARKFQESEFRSPSWPEIGWMPWINGQNVPADISAKRPGIHLNVLKRPSGQPYLSAADNTGSTGVWDKAQFKKYVYPAAARHRGQVMSVYCDGHAELVKVGGSATDYLRVAPSMPDAN